jgi:hypothetical protein
MVRAEMQDRDILETLLRGVAHRVELARTVECRGVSTQRYSETYNERQASGVVIGSELVPPAERPKAETPLGAMEASYLRLAYDVDRGWWESERVALTNNGHIRWCGRNPTSADTRKLPPEFFYTAAVFDGESEWRYDRSVQRGWIIRGVDPKFSQARGECQGFLKGIVDGLSEDRLAMIKRGAEAASYVGTGETVAYGTYHDVRLAGTIGDRIFVSKVRICPDLGFAVVRYEYGSFDVANTTPGANGRYRGGHVLSYRDFTEVVPGLWCARVVQMDSYEGVVGQATAAWISGSNFDVIELRINQPVNIQVPYHFPCDTDVFDRAATPLGSFRRPRVGNPGEPAPTNMGSEDLARAQELLAKPMQ